MSHLAKRFAYVIAVCLCLSGCQQRTDYLYLMQHPDELQAVISDCKSDLSRTKEREQQCEIAEYAAANFISILNESQTDPEKFGQRILNAEMALASAKSDVRTAEQSLSTLQISHAAAAEIKAAQDKLDAARRKYEDLHRDVKIMLAVLGVNSPE